MLKWIAAFFLGAAVSGAAVWYRERRERKEELSALSEMAGAVLDGKEVGGQEENRDTLYSKLCCQLFRLQNRTKGYQASLEADRDGIQKLISEIAHQMRTPLANLENYLGFLKEESVTQEERRLYVDAAGQAEEKLHFLVESFIKMSRLENRVIQIQKEETNLPETLENTLRQAAPKAGEKKIEIRKAYGEEIFCPHDPNWLGEAVYNLLDNAVKYSGPGGSIELGAEENEMFVRIWVKDEGTGISEGEENLVFQRFYRGKNVTTQEGFGIGLYLTREIVLLHGGFVRVKRQQKGLLVEIYLSREKGR